MNTRIFNLISMTSEVTKGHLSFQEFKKILPNTFIHESISIKNLYDLIGTSFTL